MSDRVSSSKGKLRVLKARRNKLTDRWRGRVTSNKFKKRFAGILDQCKGREVRQESMAEDC